jgi:hypothetical protein
MRYNEDETEIYDDEYHARRRREMIPDGGSVRVPLFLMDSVQREVESGRRAALSDGRGDAVRLRDEAHALMVDRMRNPKNYDPLNGRRVVNDGVVDDLSAEEVYELAQRLAPVLAVGMPQFAVGHPHEANEAQGGTAGPSRDNRRAHYPKPIRDRAEAIKLRDEAHALMVDRMRNPKNYDLNGRRI